MLINSICTEAKNFALQAHGPQQANMSQQTSDLKREATCLASPFNPVIVQHHGTGTSMQAWMAYSI